MLQAKRQDSVVEGELTPVGDDKDVGNDPLAMGSSKMPSGKSSSYEFCLICASDFSEYSPPCKWSLGNSIESKPFCV